MHFGLRPLIQLNKCYFPDIYNMKKSKSSKRRKAQKGEMIVYSPKKWEMVRERNQIEKEGYESRMMIFT